MHLCLPFLCEGAVLKKIVVGSLFEDEFPYLEVTDQVPVARIMQNPVHGA